MNRIVEKENRQMKEVLHRNISYDLLRIQAAILVVLLHVSAISWNMISPYKPQWMIINLYNSMTRGAVPIFFMLSGAFLLKDTFNKLGYKAKINTHTTSYIN